MPEILNRAEAETGSSLADYAWFRGLPMPDFGGAIPDGLVRVDRADHVHAFLNRIMALHTPFAPLTAIREAQSLRRSMQPLTSCAFEVDAEPVFDWLDCAARRAQSVRKSELACPTWEAEVEPTNTISRCGIGVQARRLG